VPFGEGIDDSALQTTPHASTRDTVRPNPDVEATLDGLPTRSTTSPESETPRRADDTQPTYVATPGGKQEQRGAASVNEKKR
jgi:hypothetical protein